MHFSSLRDVIDVPEGNHSRQWHTANGAISDAERDLESALKHDQDKPWKITEARDAVKAAEDQLKKIDW